jgi:hypothetical protein
MGASFETPDTLPSLRFERDITSDGESALPFGRRVVIYLDRNSDVWAVDTKRYEISRRKLMSGEVTLVFSLEAAPALVTSHDRDSLSGLFDRLPPPVAAQRRRALDELPTYKPAVKRIFSDNGEYVYVLPELDEVLPGSAIDVFNRNGVYLGRLELEERITTTPPPLARRDAIFVVVKDDFDIPQIVKLMIIRPD